jgi:hypothetical protein
LKISDLSVLESQPLVNTKHTILVQAPSPSTFDES